MGKPKTHSNFSKPAKRFHKWRDDFVIAMLKSPQLPTKGLVLLCEQKCTSSRKWGKYKDTKPDVDNIQKSVLDSLWGSRGVYGDQVDDAAVVHIEVLKVWSSVDRMTFFQRLDADDVREQLYQEACRRG